MFKASDILIIFEMANNHQGKVAHARKIIDEFSSFIGILPFKFAIKFQLRDLNSFIHPEERKANSKYVKRFLETELSPHEFLDLAEYARSKGFLVAATIFDENSIALFKEMGCDYLKIASCSCTDYPLLAELAEVKKPTLLSTGGASLREVSFAISKLRKSPEELSLLHCVSLYPTHRDDIALKGIKDLSSIFAEHVVGYSSHEGHEITSSPAEAYMAGARIFERHIALETNTISRNLYSLSHDETSQWLHEIVKGMADFEKNALEEVKEKERKSLKLLERGVYFDEKGEVSFAFPCLPGAKPISDRKYSENCELKALSNIFLDFFSEAIFQIRLSAFCIEKFSEVTFSYPLGEGSFQDFGAIYFYLYQDQHFVQKFIFIKNNQKIPLHLHKNKKEFMEVISGEGSIEYAGKVIPLMKGSTVTINRNTHHSLEASKDLLIKETICLMEEENSPSEYLDSRVEHDENKRKKTFPLKNGFIQYD